MKAKPSKELKFEESLERLEAVVQEMESGDLPLEEILKKYEEGNRLIKFCASKLNEAEKRIEILMKDKDGALQIKDLDLEKEEEAAFAKEDESAPNASSEGKNLF